MSTSPTDPTVRSDDRNSLLHTVITFKHEEKFIAINPITGVFQPDSYVPDNEAELAIIRKAAVDIFEDIEWQMQHRPLFSRANCYSINGRKP